MKERIMVIEKYCLLKKGENKLLTRYANGDSMWARGRGHSTTIEAAKVAVMAEAERLIIGHFSSRYKQPESLVEECRTIFPNSHIATEGETFTIEEKR